MRKMLHGMLTIVLAAGAGVAAARNIDLSTVPPRDTVQLTIYNSEDLTLVRETRVLTFQRGVNPLQFSWANTLIDASSVELTFRTRPDQLSVLDTTFPHDKPQMLYWNVQSEFDGEATVEITYFTSGISWAADYVCLANADESQMHLDGFVRIQNRSGEHYENAQIRLVVGTINLVEKIAQLAQLAADKVDRMPAAERGALRQVAAKSALSDRRAAGEVDAAGGRLEEPQIVKEGLSEYFIYTIEGTQTVADTWSKRMRSFEGAAVPFRIQYRYRPVEYGDQLVRLYLLTNDTASGLGTTPLPDGIVRVFRDNGRDGLSFLAAQPIKYVPIGDKLELNLGPDPEVIFELIKRRAYRDNLWMHVTGTDLFRRVDDGALQIEVNSAVEGWDDHEVYTQRIRNYSAKPIDVEVRRAFPGHVVFRSALAAKLHDFRTVEFTASVPRGQRVDLPFEIVRHQGRNAKQNNVTLEPATAAP
jgi:hypothetical protein